MLRVVSWAGVVQIRPQAMQGESLIPAELLLVTLSMVWQHTGQGNAWSLLPAQPDVLNALRHQCCCLEAILTDVGMMTWEISGGL